MPRNVTFVKTNLPFPLEVVISGRLKWKKNLPFPVEVGLTLAGAGATGSTAAFVSVLPGSGDEEDENELAEEP